MAAVQVHAQALLIGAILVETLDAVLAGAGALDAVVQHYVVADGQVGVGVWANLDDFAGDVASHDSGHGAAVAASGAHTDIQPVEGRCRERGA